jgi:hypothetical protein
MKHLNAFSCKVLNQLVDGLKTLEAKTIDNTRGVFMPVHVEDIGDCPLGRVVSVAHYYEQNGDLVPDPEGTFIYDGTTWYPQHLQQNTGYFTEAIHFKDGNAVYSTTALAELISFANMWLRNISEQQF